MTEHEHAEVSRKLALAIGWKPDDVGIVRAFRGQPTYCEVWPWGDALGKKWRKFDYRDPTVCWAVAERFNCFPWVVAPLAGDEWCSELEGFDEYGDTAAIAVARAVIASQEAK